MSNVRNRWIVGIWGACLMAGTQLGCTVYAEPPADAGPVATGSGQDAAVLEQVKQMASKGQDAQTAAQVNQYVDQNHDVISAILKGYMNYLKQVQTTAADGGSGAPVATGSAQSNPDNGVGENAAPSQNSNIDAAASAGQPSGGLQISGVQASGALQTSHLAGYPALPAVDPVSSLTQPTAAQLEYAAKTQKEMQARKAYLMEHPQGYSY